MPANTEILITELERIRGHMEKSYPELVKLQKLTPWERDHRLSCNQQTLSILRQLHALEKIHGMPYTEILQQIHSTYE